MTVSPEEAKALLNSQQLRCLQMVAQGLPYKEIGRACGFSHHNAYYHVSMAVKALGASSPAHAVRMISADEDVSATKSLKRSERSGPSSIFNGFRHHLTLDPKGAPVRVITALVIAAYAVLATEYLGPTVTRILISLGLS